jgi:hypothetical protein
VGWLIRLARPAGAPYLAANARNKTVQNCETSAGLSNAGVALPLDLRHLARHDVDLERSVAPNAACPLLERNFVMSGRQRHPKVSVLVRGKRRHVALLVFHHKSRAREWP